MYKNIILLLFSMISILFSENLLAVTSDLPLVIATQKGAVTNYTISLKIVAMMTILAVLPALLMTTTAFTRIIIVLAILRQAIGIPNVPNNQVLIGLSLIMTMFVMLPVIESVNKQSIQPYMNNQIHEEKAINNAILELKAFMLKQTHKENLRIFYKLSKIKQNDKNDHPLIVVLPAYVTSELKTAFQIGFVIFIPFLIIDLVVSSILMSIGMMMLSPMMISLPFKILFFILVDGWGLIVSSLVASFRL